MYVTNETSKTPIFQINQHIGDDKDKVDEFGNIIEKGDGLGIDGIIFANEVLSFNESDFIKELLFYVNSQGGDVQRSLDMFNAIAMCKQKTHSIITGFAFSCAGWIPLAADIVDMVEETGRWMCHMPYNPLNEEEQSKFMDNVVDIISKTIASKSGRGGVQKKTQDEIKKLMQENTYWNAKRMKDEGLIDNIVNTSGKVVRMEKDPITLNKTELNFFYKEYQVAQNKIVIESKQIKIEKMAFPKIVNRLNKLDSKLLGFKIELSEDATEDVISDTVMRVENRLRVVNEEMDSMTNKMTENKTAMDSAKSAMDAAKLEVDNKTKEAADATNLYNTMKAACDKLELENKGMKEKEEASNLEKATADLKFKTERATNYIDKLIEQKVIAANATMTINEVKTHMVNKAIINFDDVQLQFPLRVMKLSGPSISKTLKNGVKVDLSLIDGLKASNMERIKNKQTKTENGVVIKLADSTVLS